MLFYLIRPFHQNFSDKLVINEYVQKASYKITNRGRLVSNTLFTHSSPQAQLIELQNDVKEKFGAVIILCGVYVSLERNLGSTRKIARAHYPSKHCSPHQTLPPPPSFLFRYLSIEGHSELAERGPKRTPKNYYYVR